jgi:putative IMPACT (imprinted ancient) family translation regulator
MTVGGITLAGVGRSEIEIRKSRFIGTAVPLPDPEQVGPLIAGAGDAEARHNCWAWRHGQRYRFHDADEPVGTAGKPILAAIDGQGVDRVLVVVTRWFGGIKLGAGGLVRAYSQTAAEALKAAPQEALVLLGTVRLLLPWKWRDAVTRVARRCDATALDWQDEADGLALVLQLPMDQIDAFAAAVRDLSAGQLKPQRSD